MMAGVSHHAPQDLKQPYQQQPSSLDAQICYTRIPCGKTHAVVVLGAEGGFPLNPGTFRAQHGQVPSGETSRDSLNSKSYGADLVPHGVKVADARSLIAPPSLDTVGVELVESKLAACCSPDSLVSGDVNGPAISSYYSCVEDVVRRATGADYVKAICHAVRSEKGAAECKGAEAGYASYAHTDQSRLSWSSRAGSLVASGNFDQFPPGVSREDAERSVHSKRFAVISAWRKLNNSNASHLAVLDHTSLRKGDVLPFSIIEDGFVGGNYRLKDSAEAAARHRWLYFPAMTPGELLLFTAFDSDHPAKEELFTDQNMVASCFHTAFTDPSAPPNEPPRRSIDVRLLVVWDNVDEN